MEIQPKEGDLRIWWIPQVPMKPFHASVSSIVEARRVLDILAKYDLFQLENNIKPDFANAGGLDIYEKIDECSCWVNWESFEGETIDNFHLEGDILVPNS